MPKRTDIHKILIIGSGPIVIGQGAKTVGFAASAVLSSRAKRGICL